MENKAALPPTPQMRGQKSVGKGPLRAFVASWLSFFAHVWLIQFFRLKSDVLFPRGFFLGVFLHPGLKALAGGGIAAGEFNAGDLAIGHRNLAILVFGI